MEKHLLELDNLTTDLEMVSETLAALEMAHSEGKCEVGKDAFWLPTRELVNTIEKLRKRVDILLKPLQERNRLNNG